MVMMQALELVLTPQVILTMIAAGAFGMFLGAMPGLTATMATALLVPITFFMEPVPAIAAIVTAAAMAIFAGDLPAALLRIPGTPASAAYTEDAWRMTRSGRANDALGALLVFSAIGGMLGTLVLILASPALAEVALKFSSFEYFWLVVMGLSCAIFVSPGSALKSILSLVVGLTAATVGFDNPAGQPRFTFGNVDMMAGIPFICAMIGLFATAEVFRAIVHPTRLARAERADTSHIFRHQWQNIRSYPKQMLRGSALGTIIGALPGAGADIAAWISYAVSKRFSRTPEKFGTGHVEGLVEAGSSNNAAVSGAWIPALVFGIPGDSITAIVIGVLLIPMMKQAGYSVPRSAGLIAAGGIIAPVIPPSIAFVMFGVIAQVSITKLFLAGIFPGLIMALSLVITWKFVARKDFADTSKQPPFSMAVLFRSLREAVFNAEELEDSARIWLTLKPLGYVPLSEEAVAELEHSRQA